MAKRWERLCVQLGNGESEKGGLFESCVGLNCSAVEGREEGEEKRGRRVISENIFEKSGFNNG